MSMHGSAMMYVTRASLPARFGRTRHSSRGPRGCSPLALGGGGRDGDANGHALARGLLDLNSAFRVTARSASPSSTA